MKLRPPVYDDGLRKRTQVKFYGYDAMGREGGIRDMENLTSDRWPEIASRERRRIPMKLEAPRGLAFHNGNMIWADGRDFHFGDTVVEDMLPASDAVRQFVVLGDYVTVWPDGLWFDTVEKTHGRMDERVTTENEQYAFRAWFGSVEDEYSSQGNRLLIATADNMEPETVILALEQIFHVGDAVTISGCQRHPENNRTVLIRKFKDHAMLALDDTFALDEHKRLTVDGDGLKAGWYTLRDERFMSGTAVLPLDRSLSEGDVIDIDMTDFALTGEAAAEITAGGETYTLALSQHYITEKELTMGTYWEPYGETCEVVVSRQAPEMDVVFVHANRLMGCKGDTIYVSKLGDIFNWSVYDGTASDSWTTETGTPGSFTAGCSFGGYPRFMKNDRIFTLYGDYPAEYQLQAQEYMGAAEGSGDSLAVVNGRLFYLSAMGPCVYAGGPPTLLAEAFGLTRYKNAVSGTDGVRWYISMQDEEDAWHLFVYDTRKGLWMREDALHALAFAKAESDVWCLGVDGTVSILGRPMAPPEDAAWEEDVPWMVEFGDFTEGSPDRKLVTKLQLRMELERDAAAEIFMRYDSLPAWQRVAVVTAARQKSVTLPIIPRRLDHFRLRIEGTGAARIQSITRESAPGSDGR